MDRERIAAEIKSFLEREFPNPAGGLTESTDLLEEWFVDSFGIIETVMFLERTFGVRVGRADVNGSNFKNIASLAEFVLSRRAG